MAGCTTFSALVKYVLILTPQSELSAVAGVRALGDLVFAPPPTRPLKCVFIIGLPRSATSHIHDSLVKTCGASTATFLDNLFPTLSLQRLLQPAVRLVSARLSAAYTSQHHRIETDEYDEEDQVLLHRWHNIWIHAFFTRRFNRALAYHAKVLAFNDECMPWIERTIRMLCARDGRDLFIGKPVASSLEW